MENITKAKATSLEHVDLTVADSTIHQPALQIHLL